MLVVMVAAVVWLSISLSSLTDYSRVNRKAVARLCGVMSPVQAVFEARVNLPPVDSAEDRALRAELEGGIRSIEELNCPRLEVRR